MCEKASVAQPRIFRDTDRGIFLQKRHLNKHFMYDISKKGLTGTNFGVLFKDTLKTAL